MSNVLITGAGGFIGSHVAETFCAEGVHVGCLVRKDSNLKNIKALPVHLEYGDIVDGGSLIRAFKGYDYVIHIAAFARDWGRYETFYQTNVEGTLNVLKASLENGIRNVIITSSVSVYGEENFRQIKTEDSPHKSHYQYFLDNLFPCKMNYYRDTKALAKEKAIEFAHEWGLNLTILEPVWVYGEREFTTGFFDYLKTAKSGIPFLPGCKGNKFHVVYVKDLARAYYLAYLHQLPGVQSIIIGNQEADKMDRIYGLFCEQAGVRKPLNMPKCISYPIGFFMEFIYTLFNLKSAPLLTRGRVNMFYDNIEYATAKAERLIGFKNKYGIEEGIERTVNWYQNQKLI
ncbi:MAG: NAD-dependent epimerase/dehydratase family protein [Dehalobacterium sp.]